MPQEKLFKEIYPATDILVYPSYTDTFGFTLTEAMSFGIPIVTVGGHSRKEIVEQGKIGYVIEESKKFNLKYLEELRTLRPIIDEIEKKVEHLIKNKKLREKMSRNGIKEIKSGKFSIEKRNKKFVEVYKEALKT